MSAIAGFFQLNNAPASSRQLDEMLARMPHRGSDDSGTWVSGPVALGHRMRHTTRESQWETLPFQSRANLVITADARIDNRAELLLKLNIPTNERQTLADSQLILKAYQKWGKACPEYLLGDFAFAIWDTAQQSLFCARDTFGVHPFYFYHRPGKLFAFASEIKALFAIPSIPQDVNDVQIGYFLARSFDEEHSTFFRSVERLPAAHSMMVSTTGVRQQRYWALDPQKTLRLANDDAYATAFRSIFTTAVTARTRSVFPVGLMLSGGLDSSSIAGIMGQTHGRNGEANPIHTFSIRFKSLPQCDEYEFIDAVLAQNPGFHPQFIDGDKLSPIGYLDDAAAIFDEPFHVANLFLYWEAYRRAKQLGVRVMLDGGNGDSTMGDTSTQLADMARSLRWATLMRELHGLAQQFQCSPWSLFWLDTVKPLTPRRMLHAYRTLRGFPAHEMPDVGLISNPNFVREIQLMERLQEQQSTGTPTTAKDEHFQMVADRGGTQELEWFSHLNAFFGMEQRLPFLDRRLVEFMLALPTEQKVRHGTFRFVARQALADVVPSAVLKRTGKGRMNDNFIRNLQLLDRESVETLVFEGAEIIKPYINIELLQRITRYFYSHEFSGMAGQTEALVIWEAVMLSKWLKSLQTPQFTPNEREVIAA